MDDLNVEFLESYKRLEKLCKDIYESEKGVTSYIENMNEFLSFESRSITGWDDDLRKLKELRKIRNRLSHEEGTMHCGLCHEDDIEWLDNFKSRILKQDDPISRLEFYRRRKMNNDFENFQMDPIVGNSSDGNSFGKDMQNNESSFASRLVALISLVLVILATSLIIIVMMWMLSD